MKILMSFSIVLTAAIMASCTALVDPVPQSPQAVAHVEDYYLPLKNVGTSYAYCRKSPYGVDTVWMTMQGNDAKALMLGNEACYATGLSKPNSYTNNYYYAMNDSEAYTLGKVSCSGTDKLWLDLKSPLMVGQTWTFHNSKGSYYVDNLITATVNRRGAQMKMPDGKIYEDVAEIIYTSKSDSTVKWFAKGVGLIYSSSKTPDNDFGDEMQLIAQKN